jgi:5'-nucleotidase
VDFTVAAHFLGYFAAAVLAAGLPPGVDVFKLDVPEGATLTTPWRFTRVSRQRYFYPVPPSRTSPEQALPMGFITQADPERVEPDSDIRAVAIDRVVSLCPLSNDLTARTAVEELAIWAQPMGVRNPVSNDTTQRR